jgi:hypothetical protein
MNSKFLTATLVGAVVLFLLGFLIFGLALTGFYESNAGTATGVDKETPEWLWLILSVLATSALLTLILGWRGAADIAAGFKTGAIVGLLWGFAWDFGIYSMTNLQTLTLTLVDPILSAVYMGLGGAAIGLMLGRGAPDSL